MFSFSKAGRRLVRVGVAVGRALRLAEQPRRPARRWSCSRILLMPSPSPCCSGWRGANPTPSWRSWSPWWPRRPPRCTGWRGRTCSRSCSWCCSTARSNACGKGARVWPRAVPGPSAGGHHSVDQPARRFLRRHSDDRGLRRRRVADHGVCGRPRSAAAGLRAGRPVFPVRLGLPGGQPGESVLLSPARARVAVPARSLPVAAHHGVLLAELPPSGGHFLREHAA